MTRLGEIIEKSNKDLANTGFKTVILSFFLGKGLPLFCVFGKYPEKQIFYTGYKQGYTLKTKQPLRKKHQGLL